MKQFSCLLALVACAGVFYFNSQKVYVKGDRIECEPILSEKPAKHWYEKYDMWVLRYGFIVQVTKWSSYILPNTTLSKDGLISMFNGKKAYNYFQVVSLFQTDQVFPLRQSSFTTFMIHFLRGDAAIVHTINSKTGEYKAHELGFHTNQFFVVIESGTMFSIDIKQHTNEAYVLIGVIVVTHPHGVAVYEFPDVKELLRKYPQHAEIINRLS